MNTFQIVMSAITGIASIGTVVFCALTIRYSRQASRSYRELAELRAASKPKPRLPDPFRRP